LQDKNISIVQTFIRLKLHFPILNTSLSNFFPKPPLKMYFFILTFTAFSASIPEENDVWVLDAETLPKALSLQPKLLVEFYAPWCDHCKEFAPEYSRAASQLRKKGIRVGKIDGSQHRPLVDKYKIKGYPSLIYFVDGQPTEFTAPRTADAVVEWVTERQDRKIWKTHEVGGISTAAEKHRLIAVYFGNVSDSERSVFEFAAINVKDVLFLETNEKEEAEEFNVKAPKVVLWVDKEKRVYENDFSTLEVVKFIEKMKPAKVHEFNDKTAKMIFDYQSTTFFFLRNNEDKDKYQAGLEELAQEFKEEFIFTAVDLNGTGNPDKLSKALGISYKEQPLSLIVDFHDMFNKYKAQITEKEEIRRFINDYKEKKLVAYYKTEPLPETEFENSVKVLVGLNYNTTISDASKDVLVLYCVKDHPKCTEFMPIYERIAKDFKKWEGFLPCKFDLGTNEAEGLVIKMIPHLRLFKKDDKEGLSYGVDFTKGGVKGFLRQTIRKDMEDL
jgi:protein disulfide-isomerase A1